MRNAAFFPLMGQSGESLTFENDRVFSKQKNKLIKTYGKSNDSYRKQG